MKKILLTTVVMALSIGSAVAATEERNPSMDNKPVAGTGGNSYVAYDGGRRITAAEAAKGLKPFVQK